MRDCLRPENEPTCRRWRIGQRVRLIRFPNRNPNLLAEQTAGAVRLFCQQVSVLLRSLDCRKIRRWTIRCWLASSSAQRLWQHGGNSHQAGRNYRRYRLLQFVGRRPKSRSTVFPDQFSALRIRRQFRGASVKGRGMICGPIFHLALAEIRSTLSGPTAPCTPATARTDSSVPPPYRSLVLLRRSDSQPNGDRQGDPHAQQLPPS